MRRLACSALVATFLLASRARADDFAWPGRGTVRLSVPAGWRVASKDAGGDGYSFRAQPTAGPPLVARITLAWLPAGKRADDAKGALQEMVQPYLSGSVEKGFAPKPLALDGGTGWWVQLTDASLVGKPPNPDDLKVMRNVLGVLGDRIVMIATLQFDDASLPAVEQAMALVSSVRFEPGKVAPTKPASRGGPFEFTVPQSRVTVKVPDLGLRPDEEEARRPGYFKLSRESPQLILSGWLEPASGYRGLDAFWASETRSPAYAGAAAPTRVEKLRVGPWEAVAFDVPVPGGTSAHLRAERVLAGTWVDLHLSSTAARPAAALRKELVDALGQVDVVEKGAR